MKKATVYFAAKYLGAGKYVSMIERYERENGFGEADTICEIVGQFDSMIEARKFTTLVKRIYNMGKKDERNNIASRLAK